MQNSAKNRRQKAARPRQSWIAHILQDLPIVHKLVVLIMLICLFVTIFVSATFVIWEIQNYRQRIVNDLRTQARMLGVNSAAALMFEDQRDASQILGSLVANPSIASAAIFRPDGTVLATYQRYGYFMEEKPTVQPSGHVFADGWLHMWHVIKMQGDVMGTLYLRADQRELQSFINHSFIILAFASICALSLAFLLSTKLQDFISKPILDLAETTRVVTESKDYAIRAEKSSNDELGHLVASFNEMLTQIQNRDSALRKSEERFRGYFELGIVGMAIVSKRREWISVNNRLCEMLGYSREELMQTQPASLTHPEDARLDDRLFARMVSGEFNSYSIDKRFTRKDGSVVNAIVSARCIRDKQGDIDHILSLLQDVTERVKAEEELRRTRGYLKNLFDSVSSVLVGVDGQCRITQWNLAAEQFVNMSPEKATGQLLGDAIPVLADYTRHVEKAISAGEIQRVERIRIQDTDDVARYYEVTAYPLLARDLEGAVVRLDDVTSRIRMEELMIHSEKMLSVGALAAGMAHEINNPLAAVLQSVQVVLNRLSLELPANHKVAQTLGVRLEDVAAYAQERQIPKFLLSVRKSGERAARIVENMLSFSRKSESQFSPQDIAVILNKTVELAINDYDLKKRFDFRQIEIIREFQPDVPPVPCEETKIEQVMLNLLKNSAQAMIAQQREQKPARIILRIRDEGKFAVIEVEDNGPGFDEDVGKRIFEPFYTTKEVGTGTGLGLSISYFIITENHRGEMTAESTPGKGARFTIKLPYKRAND